MKHSDVPTALDLVVEEVGKESQRIRDAGGEALKAEKLSPAKKAISYAEKMKQFVKKVRALGEEWRKLQIEIDGATPEVKEIVRPTLPKHERRTGYTRKVEKVAPRTNFKVKFPDGKIIQEKRASLVLAKTIEALGTEKVAAVGESMCGEPLVTKDISNHSKYTYASVQISGGWFVATHCNTKTKIKKIKILAKALKVKLVIEEI